MPICRRRRSRPAISATGGSVPVAGALQDQRLLGAGCLWPPRGLDQRLCGSGRHRLRREVIAQHPRSYDSGDMVFDPVHYLPLIERKIMAFDQAAPLQEWDLPEAFATLQRLLEARQGKAGKREYVQVLRLVEQLRARCAALRRQRRPANAELSASMPSSIWCCAVLNAGRPGWIWMSIHSCPAPMSPRPPLHPT
jgi:hypothetical protein